MLLPLKERGGLGECHSDVEFGNSHLDTKVDVGLKDRFDVGCASDEQMTLKTNAVQRDSIGLELLDQVHHGGVLRTTILEVVVVDIQLDGRVGGLGCFEGNGNVVLAEGVVEDAGAVCSILVEGFWSISLVHHL